jgi:hypothetical protein
MTWGILNTDFLPTFTDLAGVKTPEYVDGRFLRPVLEGSATTWCTAILLELRTSIYGIRTSEAGSTSSIGMASGSNTS